MSIIEIIDAFSFYGLDIAVLSAITCAAVQIVKITVFKKLRKKTVTFLPVIFGTVFYAAYAAIRHMSFAYIAQNYVDVLEHGFSVGALSTLVYVLYEQFIREKSTNAAQGVIATLIEGYVPGEKIDALASQICEAIEKDVTGNGASRIAEILSENSNENIGDEDIRLLARLIIETLAHINAAN